MKIAIIAAHPDDEAFGCIGTVLKAQQKGAEISCLWLTDGIGARGQGDDKGAIRKLGNTQAVNYLKLKHHKNLDFPDNRMDSLPFLEVVQSIETFILNVQPDVIYTHFYNDLNIDHALTVRAVMTAIRPGSATSVNEIYAFEVVSSTEWAVGDQHFKPDTYVDISELIEQKKEYINCYEDELRSYPHPRSLESILTRNRMRGAEVNLAYAEAFMTLRRVIHD